MASSLLRLLLPGASLPLLGQASWVFPPPCFSGGGDDRGCAWSCQVAASACPSRLEGLGMLSAVQLSLLRGFLLRLLRPPAPPSDHRPPERPQAHPALARLSSWLLPRVGTAWQGSHGVFFFFNLLMTSFSYRRVPITSLSLSRWLSRSLNYFLSLCIRLHSVPIIPLINCFL